MKKNIAILGFDTNLCDAVAEKLSANLGMFFLGLEDLCCYHACRKSVSEIRKGDGDDGVKKFYNKALSDFCEYENTTASGNVAFIDKGRLAKLLPTTLVIFLGSSSKALKEKGFDIKSEADYCRQRFYKYYDIYIKTEKKTSDLVLKEVYSAVEGFFTEDTNDEV